MHARPKSPPKPLSADERALCDRVATRLHADLGVLVNLLPEAAQSGSGMAKHLGIVRNTTQRVMHALRDQSPSPETHAKLIARIEAVGSVDSKSSLGSIEARQALFNAAMGVTGRSAQTGISLYAFRRSAENPEVLQRAIASGLIQTTIVPGGMPIVIRAGDTLKWDDPKNRSIDLLDDTQPHGNTPQALLKEFTTHPLPTVSSQGSADNLVQVIDPAKLDGPQTLAVITAARSNHPFTDPETGKMTLDEVWSLVNCPTAQIIFDVYLHRDIERMVRPGIDAQLWYPNLSSPGGQRWITRYPSPPRLELLGEGIGRAQTKAHPRHGELTNHFFSRLGWDPGEFVGFRCEVIYPIWRAGYCMSFQPAQQPEG